MIISIRGVSSISSGDVVLLTPANISWTNLTNFTTGYNFSWSDTDDNSYEYANCTLYVGNTSHIPTLATSVFGQQSAITANNTVTTFYQSADFVNNDTTLYWTVPCFNASSNDAQPLGWAPEAFELRQDNVVPFAPNVTNTSFINRTWTNVSSTRWEVNITDTNYTFSPDHTLNFLNSTSDIIGASDIAAGTAVNVTLILADGQYTLRTQACDPAGSCNTSATNHGVWIDNTAPVITLVDPTPANGSARNVSFAYINFTVVEQNNDTISIDFDGTVTFPIGWSPFDAGEDAASGNASAYDGDWSTFADSVDNDTIIFLNWTSTTGTTFEDVTKIDYKFRSNVTNDTGSVRIDFFNHTADAWANVYINVTSSSVPFNKTISTLAGTDFANITKPFQVRINLTNNETNGTAKFYQSEARFFFQRCSGTTPSFTCYYNFTGITDKKNKFFNVTVNDTTGNSATSTTRLYSIDTGGTVIDTAFNWTITDSIISWRINISDTVPSNCTANIYSRSGALVSNVQGTLGSTSGTSTNCTGTISAANIATEGAFTVEYLIEDETGATNTSNKTGVYTDLFTGWNLITFDDTNRTSLDVCNMIENCTQVSWFNNTAKTFTTFSTSTSTVNNDTQIVAADAVYIFVSANDSMLVNDHVSTATSIFVNITDGWNTMGLIFNTSMNTTIHVNDTDGDKNITWGSWLNTSADKFYTCSQARETCTATTSTAVEVELKRGYAVWVLSDGGPEINRSAILG